jgi:hypothetical protein
MTMQDDDSIERLVADMAEQLGGDTFARVEAEALAAADERLGHE